MKPSVVISISSKRSGSWNKISYKIDVYENAGREDPILTKTLRSEEAGITLVTIARMLLFYSETDACDGEITECGCSCIHRSVIETIIKLATGSDFDEFWVDDEKCEISFITTEDGLERFKKVLDEKGCDHSYKSIWS